MVTDHSSMDDGYITCSCGSPYAFAINQGKDWREIMCDACEQIWYDGNDPDITGANR